MQQEYFGLTPGGLRVHSMAKRRRSSVLGQSRGRIPPPSKTPIKLSRGKGLCGVATVSLALGPSRD
jgi:hypothetical protein